MIIDTQVKINCIRKRNLIKINFNYKKKRKLIEKKKL
jgi:hypothetical protein